MIDTSRLDESANTQAVELRDALVDYKQRSGRMFPTCSEVLEVIRGLGYERTVIEDAPLDSITEAANEPTSVTA